MRFKYVGGLACLGIILAAPLAAQQTVWLRGMKSFDYVSNRAGTTISVIDTATNKVLPPIEGVEQTEAVAFSKDGSQVFVAIGGDTDAVAVYDQKTRKHIKDVKLSGWPNDLRVTKDGKLAIVCINDTGAFDFISTDTLQLIKTIPVPAGKCHDLEVTGDSKYVVGGGRFATIIDLQKLEPVGEIKFEETLQPLTIESNPDGSGKRIYFEINKLNGFIVTDFATRKEVTRVHFPEEPKGFLGSTNTAHGIGIAPDGKTIWANSSPSNAVFCYSLPDLKLLGVVRLPTIPVPGRDNISSNPDWIDFTPDSKTVYVTMAHLHSVVAIDVNTRKLITQIQVGEAPSRHAMLVLP